MIALNIDLNIDLIMVVQFSFTFADSKKVLQKVLQCLFIGVANNPNGYAHAGFSDSNF